ncbi:fasciclin domain-containing protein [Mucilaginibacter gynuensis]|uniref:Fasciclin domain-containing protein n=1 Tax=Mucilaginibacter gynuensis TaxID=1302236 RepID=A0ABP8FWA0_9SPHI
MQHGLWYAGVVLLLLLASCKKNDNPEKLNSAKPTVFAYINANKNLSLYQAALKRAGLYNAETFSNGGPFTVFAPVDSAFTKAGLTLDKINSYDPQALASILKYAIVYGKISSSSLIGFYTQNVFGLNEAYKPTLTKNYYGIFLDGIPLETNGSTDLNDGVVHQITRVPFPPAENIFSLISKTEDLTLFTAAVKRAGYENKYSAQQQQYYYTLFAPTNEAFKKFGYPDVASIENADPVLLQRIFNSLIFDRGTTRLLTSAFRGGYALGYKYIYVQTDGFTIIATGNIMPTHIIRPDIMATNGVIHVVDQVMAQVFN